MDITRKAKVSRGAVAIMADYFAESPLAFRRCRRSSSLSLAARCRCSVQGADSAIVAIEVMPGESALVTGQRNHTPNDATTCKNTVIYSHNLIPSNM